MSDTLTVLTSEIGKHLSKAFRGENYDPCGFIPGSSFAVSEITVTDLETLSDALRSMETEQKPDDHSGNSGRPSIEDSQAHKECVSY